MLADSASLHLSIDLELFVLEVGKNRLMTANKVRHFPFSYEIFTMQVEAAIQVCCARTSTFHERSTKPCASNKFFLSLSL